MSTEMFCYQCEQTGRNGTGCYDIGVCGKDAKTAAVQDIIIYLAKGIANYLSRARKLGVTNSELDKVLVDSLFYSVTNVNFDADFLAKHIQILKEKRLLARQLYESACAKENTVADILTGPASFEPADDIDSLISQAAEFSIAKKIEKLGDDLAGLQELLMY
ncbi:MAG: hydroxylamine reductase, partial [Thiotrichaceae bacterium]|nr:hydroxylamine reductase [Thiotrichaceae bacterium]